MTPALSRIRTVRDADPTSRWSTTTRDTTEPAGRQIVIDRMYATVLTVGGVVFAGCLLLGEAVDAMGGSGRTVVPDVPDRVGERFAHLG